ncbi:MAG: fibro-slime domain-containing protein [Fibrobacter sp.]|nr:fibro-slime domain-containing protein [Fibrobacter sp.]
MLQKTRTGRSSILSFVLLLISSFCLQAEIIIHIQHPWASDSARLANPLYIQSNESGWYPGKKMIDEGGNWFTYTLRTMTQTTNDRIEFMSSIATQYNQYDNRIEYPQENGSFQLNISRIFESNQTASEIWITVTDLSEPPLIEFTPPPGKIIYFFKPWDMGGAGIWLEGFSPVKMRGLRQRCGWSRYTHYGSVEELKVRFFNSNDSTWYSTAGLGDSSYMDLSGSFVSGDTVWVAPDPVPDGVPKIVEVDPGLTANCGTITLAAKLRDKGTHPDFGNDSCPITLSQGLVEPTLSSNGKPVAAGPSKCTGQFDWFEPEIYENGYTNETCRNLELFKNEDGLYEYDTNAFFPIDDFQYLDGEETVPNPNYDLQVGHNYFFTMELACEFEYVKGQTFYFRGDDDVWVFIDSQLVVDIGGVHDALEGEVDLDTLGLTEGQTYSFKLFFAERHCCGSNFRLVTSINLRTSSRLYFEGVPISEGITQYNMFEKISGSNLSCDFSEVPTDTQKAVVEFFIEGEEFSEPMRLLAGNHYGGITISTDYSSFVLNESAFQGLSPGDYVIRFYSPMNRAQNGSVSFTVPEILKPPRVSNPLIHGAYYADNGYGRVDRAELYFQNDFTKMPDSILLSWPSILDSRMVYGGGIVLDSADPKHITVKPNEPFAQEVTTSHGSDKLGFSYSYDTSFADPHEIVPLRISDSVGPLITGAVLVERTGSGNDTLLLTFSEQVARESVVGSSLILLKGGLPLELSVLSYYSRLDTLIVITAHQEISPQYGDSIRINPDGPLKDNIGNGGHRLNRPVSILLRRTPANILHAFYRDLNADGTIDEAVLSFDRPVDPASVIAEFSFTGANKTGELGAALMRRGENESIVKVNIAGAFTGNMECLTSGLMYVNVRFTEFSDVSRTQAVSDSAAPVLKEALYIPGLFEDVEKPDTLIVVFSEYVNRFNSPAPFIFRGNSAAPYKMTLEPLYEKDNRWVFTVNSAASVFPSEKDSVWIDPSGETGDTLNNIQRNEENRRVLLQLRPAVAKFQIRLGPNPFNPYVKNLTIQVDPSVKTRGTVSFKADVWVYDQIGNEIFKDSRKNENSGPAIINLSWDGRNVKGRMVGAGAYLCVVKVTDLKLKTVLMSEFVIGVVR